MARRGFRERMVSQRRLTFWFSAIHVRTTIASASEAAVATSLNAAALLLRPFTVVRQRGYVYVRSDQDAASENYDGAYGSIVVQDTASAVGITAVPEPIIDSQSSWMVYVPFTGRFEFQSAVGARENQGQRIEFDSKAMRKVNEGEDIVTVVASATISAGLICTSFVRTLIKLH